jgi:predicted alternative tryptophan synthase beta-subunit
VPRATATVPDTAFRKEDLEAKLKVGRPKEPAMEARGRRNVGSLIAAAGLAAVVYAEYLVGVTTETGATDWVSIITAVAGVVAVAIGLFLIFHKRG